MIHRFFVYGTLKQNHLRSRLWPHPPVSVQPALVRGSLFDSGSYPGLGSGDDWVLGELWTLKPEEARETLIVLDRVEEYDAALDRGGYLRREVDAYPLPFDATSDNPVREAAYTYLVATETLTSNARRIGATHPVGNLLVAQWPDSQSRVPTSLEDE